MGEANGQSGLRVKHDLEELQRGKLRLTLRTGIYHDSQRHSSG